MRQKVTKELNKLARLLKLTKAESRKLKRDYRSTIDRSLSDLKTRIQNVEANMAGIDE